MFQAGGTGSSEIGIIASSLRHTPAVAAVVAGWVSVYKQYRDIIALSDIIHVRRPNGQTLDAFIADPKVKKLRSTDDTKSLFDRLVKPRIGDIPTTDIRRSHISEMLAEIADDYEEELDGLASQMDKIIEPLTMMILGVLVGFLIYAIYGPMFSLGDVVLGKKG
jgi:hypothetical protein